MSSSHDGENTEGSSEKYESMKLLPFAHTMTLGKLYSPSESPILHL